jgi:hypothetical protein
MENFNVWKGFCKMLDIDWAEIVSSYKIYVANNGESAVPFDVWLESIYLSVDESEDDEND